MKPSDLWIESLSGSPDSPSSASPALASALDPSVPRRMHDSYSELTLPFASSPALDQYINATGGLRMGKLMEHLDSLAGSISYMHLLGPAAPPGSAPTIRGLPFYIVTAGCDRYAPILPAWALLTWRACAAGLTCLRQPRPCATSG
jgi:acyl-coenzyme A thioesterase 9